MTLESKWLNWEKSFRTRWLFSGVLSIEGPRFFTKCCLSLRQTAPHAQQSPVYFVFCVQFTASRSADCGLFVNKPQSADRLETCQQSTWTVKYIQHTCSACQYRSWRNAGPHSRVKYVFQGRAHWRIDRSGNWQLLIRHFQIVFNTFSAGTVYIRQNL